MTNDIRTEADAFIRQRLIAWAVRWAIAFVILWLLTSSRPDLNWLWPLSVLFAAASLGVTLFLAGRVRARVAEEEAKRAELDATIAAHEAEEDQPR